MAIRFGRDFSPVDDQFEHYVIRFTYIVCDSISILMRFRIFSNLIQETHDLVKK